MFSFLMLKRYIHRLLATLLVLPLLVFASSLWAQAPGRGATADFEVEYLQFIIDHHYSALRLTEIAAGTAEIRQAEISNEEGVSPTPDSEALEGRAELDALRSLAREVNRRHREEILTAQRYLRDWYGMEHSPQITEDGDTAIQNLEQSQNGEDFDQNFMETLSRHHYQALTPSLNCIVGRDILHNELYRFCKGILDKQLLEIEGMRELLSSDFSVDDFQPFSTEDDGNGTDTDTGNGSSDGTGGGDQTGEGDSAESSNTQPDVVQSDEQTDVL